MAFRVALTMCPPWGLPSLPLGIAYLDEYLRAHGIETRVVDLNLGLFDEVPAEVRALWLPGRIFDWLDEGAFSPPRDPFARMIEGSVRRLLAAGADLVGFSANEANLRLTAAVAAALRREDPRMRIVVGGPGVFAAEGRAAFAEGTCDAFAIGEGEATFLELVQSLDERGTWDRPVPGALLPGLPFETRGPIRDLGEIPFPRFAGFDVPRYLALDVLPVLFSRGCYCRCHFCGDFPLWRGYRYRPPERIAQELEHHIHEFGIRRFRLNDLAMNGNLKALSAACDLLIARGLSLAWGGNAVIREMPPELFEKLRRAGCTTFNVGLESGSEAVLARMNKRHTNAQAAEFLRRAHAAGIGVNAALIVGFPGEGERELAETKRFLSENRERIASISPLCVSFLKPLSPIAEEPARFGVTVLPRYSWLSYVDKDGLDYPARLNRLREMRRFLAGIGIPVDEENVFGELPEIADYLRTRTLRGGEVIAVLVAGALQVLFRGKALFGTQGLHLVHVGDAPAASHVDFAWEVEREGEDALVARGVSRAKGKQAIEWRVTLLSGAVLRLTVDLTTRGRIGEVSVRVPLSPGDVLARDLLGRRIHTPATDGRENGHGIFVAHAEGGGYLLDARGIERSPRPAADRFERVGERFLGYRREFVKAPPRGRRQRVLDLDLVPLDAEQEAAFFGARTVERGGVRATLASGALHVFRGEEPIFGHGGLRVIPGRMRATATDVDLHWETESGGEYALVARGKAQGARGGTFTLTWRVELGADGLVHQTLEREGDAEPEEILARIELPRGATAVRDLFGRVVNAGGSLTADARDQGRSLFVGGADGAGFLLDARRADRASAPIHDRFYFRRGRRGERFLVYRREFVDPPCGGERLPVLDLDVLVLAAEEAAAFFRARTLIRGDLRVSLLDGALRLFVKDHPLLGRQGVHLSILGSHVRASDADFLWTQEGDGEVALVAHGRAGSDDGAVELSWAARFLSDGTLALVADLAGDLDADGIVAQFPLRPGDAPVRDGLGQALGRGGVPWPARDAREHGRAVLVRISGGRTLVIDGGKSTLAPEQPFDRFETTTDARGRTTHVAYQRRFRPAGQHGAARRILDLDLRLTDSKEHERVFLDERTISSGRAALSFQDGFWFLTERTRGGARLLSMPALYFAVVVDGAPGLRAEKFRWEGAKGSAAGGLAFAGRPYDGGAIVVRQEAQRIGAGAFLLRIGFRAPVPCGVIARVDLPLAEAYSDIRSERRALGKTDAGLVNLSGSSLAAAGRGVPPITLALAASRALEPEGQTPEGHREGIGLLVGAERAERLKMVVHTGRYPVPVGEAFRWIGLRLTVGRKG